MISQLVSRLIIVVFGTLYPAYASFKAVRTKNVKEYVKWMMYWIVFALFTTVETFTDVFISFWFPFYYEFKIILVLWLLSPATKGSSILYRKFVHPMLTRREQEIDEYIARAREQGYHTVMHIGTKGMQYATNVLVQTAVKGGGGLVNQIRRSYSLSDLSSDKDLTSDLNRNKKTHITETEDEIDESDGSTDRLRRPRGYSPRRSSSGSGRVEMYFPEVDVDVRQHGTRQREPSTPYSHIRSTEDVSSGYSSAEPLYPGHVAKPENLSSSREHLVRTASVGSTRSTRAKSSRGGVTPKRSTIPEGSDSSRRRDFESESEEECFYDVSLPLSSSFSSPEILLSTHYASKLLSLPSEHISISEHFITNPEMLAQVLHLKNIKDSQFPDSFSKQNLADKIILRGPEEQNSNENDCSSTEVSGNQILSNSEDLVETNNKNNLTASNVLEEKGDSEHICNVENTFSSQKLSEEKNSEIFIKSEYGLSNEELGSKRLSDDHSESTLNANKNASFSKDKFIVASATPESSSIVNATMDSNEFRSKIQSEIKALETATEAKNNFHVTEVKEDSRVVEANNSSHVNEVKKNSHAVEAKDSLCVTKVKENSHAIEAKDSSCENEVKENSHAVEAKDSSHVTEVKENSHAVEARGNSQVKGESNITEGKETNVKDPCRTEIKDNLNTIEIKEDSHVTEVKDTSLRTKQNGDMHITDVQEYVCADDANGDLRSTVVENSVKGNISETGTNSTEVCSEYSEIPTCLNEFEISLIKESSKTKSDLERSENDLLNNENEINVINATDEFNSNKGISEMQTDTVNVVSNDSPGFTEEVQTIPESTRKIRRGKYHKHPAPSPPPKQKGFEVPSVQICTENIVSSTSKSDIEQKEDHISSPSSQKDINKFEDSKETKSSTHDTDSLKLPSGNTSRDLTPSPTLARRIIEDEEAKFSEAAVAARLVLKPGIVKHIGPEKTPGESSKTPVFISTSPKMKRKSSSKKSGRESPLSRLLVLPKNQLGNFTSLLPFWGHGAQGASKKKDADSSSVASLSSSTGSLASTSSAPNSNNSAANKPPVPFDRKKARSFIVKSGRNENENSTVKFLESAQSKSDENVETKQTKKGILKHDATTSNFRVRDMSRSPSSKRKPAPLADWED